MILLVQKLVAVVDAQFDNLEDREGIRLMAEQNRVTAENESEV